MDDAAFAFVLLCLMFVASGLVAIAIGALDE